MLNIYEKCPQPRFFTCGCLENDGGFLHIRRTLNCDVLIFVTEGTLFITMNDTDLAVCPGEYVLLPSGTEHFHISEHCYRCDNVYLSEKD